MKPNRKHPKAKRPDPAAGKPNAPDAPRQDGSVTDAKVEEIGGRGGPDPTRYGDWEKDGRCVDF